MLSFLTELHVVDLARRRSRPAVILINDGLIETVGVRTQRIRGARTVGMGGAYALPGFTDAHAHILSYGIQLQRVNLEACDSLDACLARLSEARDRDVVIGVNWDDSTWRQGSIQELDRNLLDRIDRRRPIVMRRVCGHFAVANSAALAMIGSGWRIVDRRNGRLYEDVVLNLNDVFPPDRATRSRAITLAHDRALQLGITSVHEITDLPGFLTYQEQRARMKLRTSLYLTHRSMDALCAAGIRRGFGDAFLSIAGVKLFLDGSVGARTAAVARPYSAHGGRGRLLVTSAALARFLERAEANGLQVMMHAIGDRAIATILSAFARAGIRENRLRHRIEHAEIVNERQLAAIARRGLILCMQPNFVRRWQQPGGLYERQLGAARRIRMNPFRSVRDFHITLAFGSDNMPLGPLFGLAGATQHPDPSQRLDPIEALRAYTVTGHLATFQEHKLGRIAPGFAADMVFLDRDPLAPGGLAAARVLATMVAGRLWRFSR